jgi:hypothetical protein
MLPVLDTALQHRSVTMPSDEALCIATLMNLELRYILEVEDQEGRMARVWEKIAQKEGGIPASIIFFEDNRLHLSKWGWAPRSLLSSASSLMLDANARITRWSSTRIGTTTDRGLRVRFSGFLLSPKKRHPDMPLHPWEGINRAVEDRVHFQDTESGQWYKLMDAFRSFRLSKWTAEELKTYDDKQDSPLCRAIQKDDWAVILNDSTAVSRARLTTTDTIIHFGALVKIIDSVVEPGCAEPGYHVRLLTTFPTQVLVAALNEKELLILETTKRLAEKLRGDEITKLLANSDRESNEYKKVLGDVKQRMKDLMKEAFDLQGGLKEAVRDIVGDGVEEYMWVTIAGWFANDNIGSWLADDQVWYVDGDSADVVRAPSANEGPQI